MKKQLCILLLISSLITALSLSITVNALFGGAFVSPARAGIGIGTGEFEDFELEDYLAIIDAIAEQGEYPHFLEKNSQRYEEYQENNPNVPFDTVIARVNVNIDKQPYEVIEPVPDPDKITVLVNKHFFLPDTWEPGDWADIGNGHKMRAEAAEQYIKMRDAMREDNLSLVTVIVFRSYATQRGHFSNAVARLGQASAEGGFARAGHSEHQTGLAVDVLHKGHDGGLMMDMGFENSAQFRWLVENAHNYGFILRYPNGYRNVSGFMFEPWHWRYVGVPIATAMKDREIALFEEFYGRYLIREVLDRVNDYILEQQRLAEEAEAAAIAAEIAAAEEAARLEAEAIAAAEAEQAAKEAAAEAERAASKRNSIVVSEQSIVPAHSHTGARHFLEGITVALTLLALIFLYIKRKM